MNACKVVQHCSERHQYTRVQALQCQSSCMDFLTLNPVTNGWSITEGYALTQSGIAVLYEQPQDSINSIYTYPSTASCGELNPERIKKRRERDKLVNQTLISQGYLVIRLWEHEINNNLKECMETIKPLLIKKEDETNGIRLK